MCALLFYVLKTLEINVIDHKFLVQGHTMMECDSMHSAIVDAQKYLAIYSQNEWINVLKSARRHKPYNVHEFTHDDFYNLKDLARKTETNRKRTDRWNNKLAQSSMDTFSKGIPW